MSADKDRAYGRIIKSSSIVGGAQGINVLIGMLRVKVIALLIGPVGVGLIGTYRATQQMIASLAGLGLRSSAVREIAEASGREDPLSVGRVVLTLRRMTWLTGTIGAVSVVVTSPWLSQLTFESRDHQLEIACLGITILFSNLQGGMSAVVQGTRRVADLARIDTFGALLGSAVAVALYVVMGVEGIVPSILALDLTLLAVTWWFARRVEVTKVTMSWRESFAEAGGMVKLGVAFMWSALLLAAVAYATRILIAREIDLVAVGIYSAAFSLSGIVVNFILGAMGADYYPGLVSIASDHRKMGELVNQQTEVGLLLAVPGLLGTIAVAPWLIRLFYSAEFWQAAELLQWFVLGCLGRVVSWPIGFVVLAKGHTRLFAGVQTLVNLVHIALTWGLVVTVGLDGVAYAFVLLYVGHIGLMKYVARSLIGFTWSREVWLVLAGMAPAVAITFLASRFLPPIPGVVFGLAVTLVVGVLSLRELTRKLGPDHRVYRLALRVPILRSLLPERAAK